LLARFGDILKDEALAAAMGVDRTILPRWRAGERTIPIGLAPAVAAYTGDYPGVVEVVFGGACRVAPHAEPDDLAGRSLNTAIVDGMATLADLAREAREAERAGSMTVGRARQLRRIVAQARQDVDAIEDAIRWLADQSTPPGVEERTSRIGRVR
jgi:hypothetical protein